MQGQIDLKISGNTESNLWPDYVIIKVVHGSFHPANQKSCSTAGIQCACNSLHALCWSKVKEASVWNSSDLDHTLTQGDVFKQVTGTK